MCVREHARLLTPGAPGCAPVGSGVWVRLSLPASTVPPAPQETGSCSPSAVGSVAPADPGPLPRTPLYSLLRAGAEALRGLRKRGVNALQEYHGTFIAHYISS